MGPQGQARCFLITFNLFRNSTQGCPFAWDPISRVLKSNCKILSGENVCDLFIHSFIHSLNPFLELIEILQHSQSMAVSSSLRNWHWKYYVQTHSSAKGACHSVLWSAWQLIPMCTQVSEPLSYSVLGDEARRPCVQIKGLWGNKRSAKHIGGKEDSVRKQPWAR
jgi:hypothetical protein